MRWFVLCSLLTACAVSDRIAVPRADAGADTDAGLLCPLPVIIPGAVPSCSAALAQARVKVGLCTCLFDIESDGELEVDAFDSRLGPYDAAGANAGGELGTRGNVYLNARTHVTGDATVMGPAGLVLGPTTDLTVGGELGVRAPLFNAEATATVTVAGDVLAGGALRLGTLTVGGDLYRSGNPLDYVETLTVAGQEIVGPIEPESACVCDPFSVPDIVTAAATSNDNAALGVAADALVGASGEASLTLTCGRVYLHAITEVSPADVTVVVEGNVALFVGGAVDVSAFSVVLAPGASLDVFVAGPLALRAGSSLGDPARPAALRVYTGDATPITLGGDRAFSGLLHADHAPVIIESTMHFHGALVAWEVDAAAGFFVHQDLAFDALASTCP
jgi:hypothetical protein